MLLLFSPIISFVTLSDLSQFIKSLRTILRFSIINFSFNLDIMSLFSLSIEFLTPFKKKKNKLIYLCLLRLWIGEETLLHRRRFSLFLEVSSIRLSPCPNRPILRFLWWMDFKKTWKELEKMNSLSWWTNLQSPDSLCWSTRSSTFPKL